MQNGIEIPPVGDAATGDPAPDTGRDGDTAEGRPHRGGGPALTIFLSLRLIGLPMIASVKDDDKHPV